MKARLKIVIACVVFYSVQLFSQNMDSLKLILKNARHDTTKCNALNALIEAEGDETIWPAYNEDLKKIAEKHLKSEDPNSSLGKFYHKQQAAAYNNIGYLKNQQGNVSEALRYYRISLSIQQKIDDKSGMGASLNNIGNMYQNQGNPDTALVYFLKGMKILEGISDKRGMAYSYNNIGNVYLNQGIVNKALEYFFKSLKLHEATGDKFGISHALNNIGIVYNNQDEYKKALEYYQRGLKINESLHFKEGMANSLNNIGVLYQRLSDFENAIDYENKSLSLYTELGSKDGMANTLCNIGLVYSQHGKLDKALDFYMKALIIQEEIQNKDGISNTITYIGDIYLKKRDYKMALKYSERALEYSRKLGYPDKIRNAANQLFQIYKSKGDYKTALKNYELFVLMRDSLNNAETKKASIKSQIKYEYEKQAAADSVKHQEQQKVKDAQLAAQSASLKQEKTQRWALYCGIGLITLFSGFMYNRFRITRKQKQIIETQKVEVDQQRELADVRRLIAEEQKHIIEEKQKEILDSIHYAKRIQQAMLTSEEYMTTHFPVEKFIFYQPKDIVSGDFYWALSHHNRFYISAADCTGHGVPGAFMSLLNISFLNGIVIERGISDPDQILNEQRREIIKALNPSGTENSKDGMDCSLCAFELSKNTGDADQLLAGGDVVGKLDFALANNPLWLIRNNELIEYKADKMPVGKYDENQKDFTLHTIDLIRGDSIYLFTDGFADQFGGAKGKKFKYKHLKETLLANVQKTMLEQKEILANTINDWKGDLEQVDDILVIGVRI